MALVGIGPNRIVFGGERAGQKSLTLQRDNEGNVSAVTDGCCGLDAADQQVLIDWPVSGDRAYKWHLSKAVKS